MQFKRKNSGLFESNRVFYVPVTDIRPNPAQPRTYFSPEGLQELSASIRQHGILQPLSVRRRPAGGFELISGERRLRAARMADLRQVPCILVSATDVESSLLALVENLQRRDLDYVEEAAALQQLIATYHLSQEEAARRIGKSQSAVANKLRLLRLSPELLRRLREEGLSERHARALLRLDEDARPEALEQIIAQQWNVAQTDAYIDALLSPPEEEPQQDEPGAETPLSPEEAQQDKPGAPPKRKRPTIYLKDIRLFLNSVNRGLATMQRSGLDAVCGRQETEDDLILTIRIPKRKQLTEVK
jgi:ParB family chromosome partitioning protein